MRSFLLRFAMMTMGLCALPRPAAAQFGAPRQTTPRVASQLLYSVATNQYPAATSAVPAAAASPAGVGKLPAGTEVTADSLEYLQDRKMIVGTGHVIIEQGADSLQADSVTINTLSQDVYARGNVVFRQAGKVYQLQEFKYNLLKKTGDFGEFKAYVAPYYITAKESKRVSTNETYLKEMTLTTCDGDTPEYLISAEEASLKGDHLLAKGVKFYFGFMPFFYLPTLARQLSAHDTYWEFMPGYSSRYGAFLLSAYNYKMTDTLKGRTRLDVRSRRGLAVGEDVLWTDPTTNKTWKGEFNAYYLEDQKPFRNAEEEERQKDVVDNERYRLRLSHVESLTPTDYAIAEVNYLSDPDVLEDFFRDEFRLSSQPENRVSLTHRGEGYTAGLLFNKRLNDFYGNVDRVPELSLDVQRQPIDESPFYYESHSSASYLSRVYPTEGEGVSDKEDYDAFRLDTRHTIYYPTRHFGFLNLIPRAGYRGTFYSATRTEGVATNTAIVTDTNGVSSVTTQMVNVVTEGSGDLRNLYELGLETSFKAFRTWDDLIVLEDGDGLRHVVEPYANYTYNPEPNLRPFELPQFDSVDELDMRQDIRFGVRNKFQTRRRGFATDIVDADVFITYRIDKPQPEMKDYSNLGFDVELRLADRFPVDFDGTYDIYEGNINTFNTQLAYLMTDSSTLSLEYRYRKDKQDLISGEFMLFPNDPWSFQLYGRYDAELSRIEEHAYFIEHKTQCMGYGLGVQFEPGYDSEKDDTQAWFRIWVLAFPGSNVGPGR